MTTLLSFRFQAFPLMRKPRTSDRLQVPSTSWMPLSSMTPSETSALDKAKLECVLEKVKTLSKCASSSFRLAWMCRRARSTQARSPFLLTSSLWWRRVRPGLRLTISWAECRTCSRATLKPLGITATSKPSSSLISTRRTPAWRRSQPSSRSSLSKLGAESQLATRLRQRVLRLVTTILGRSDCYIYIKLI